MSKIFGIHFAMHDDTGCLRQWVPGDEVPVWAESRVGDHCLMLPPSEDDDGDTAPGIEPPAEPEADAEDPAEPAEDAAPLDFTAPAKPARGRPRKP